MVTIESVVGSLVMRDEFSRVFSKFDTDLSGAASKTISVGRQMQTAGVALTKAVTLPIAAVGGLSVKAFSTFDDAMNQSLAIMGDVSDSMRGDMADAARELPLVVRASAADSAAGFEFLARAGKTAEQSLALLPITARFANAGVIDLALGTDLLTDAQSALGLSTKNVQQDQENLTRVSDVLVMGNTIANASVIELSKSITTKAGTAMRQYKVDIEDGVAVLAAWADQGVKGELAGTRFGIVMRDLTTKAIKNREEFESLGIEVFDSADKMNSLADIVEDLEDALDGMSDRSRKAALLQLGFSDKSVQATSSLLGLSDQIRIYEQKLRNAGGETQRVSDNQMKSFAAQMGVVKNRIVDVGIELGSKLAPIIKQKVIPVVVSVTDFISRMIDRFGKLPTGVKTATIAVVAFVAAIGPLLVAAGAIVTAWGFVAGALGGAAGLAAISGVVAGFTAIGAIVFGPRGIVEAFKTVVDAAEKLWSETTKGRTFLANLARVISVDLIRGIRSAINAIKDAGIRFLIWTGLSKDLKIGLRAVNEIIEKALKLYKSLADNVKFIGREIKIALGDMAGFKAGLSGILAIMSITNPKFVEGANTIRDWVDRAAEATNESAALEEAAEQLAREIEKGTGSVEDMGKAFASASAQWDKAAKKAGELTEEVKKLTGEEKKQLALQNALTEATKNIVKETREFSGAAEQVRIQVNALGESISEIDRGDVFAKMSVNMSFVEVAAFTVHEQIQAISDAETKLVEEMFRQLDVQTQIEGLFARGDIDKKLRDQLLAINGIVKATGKWKGALSNLSEAFNKIGGEIGAIGSGILQVIDSIEAARAAPKGSDGRKGAIASGITAGADILFQATGFAQQEGGISKFGGKKEGNFADLGKQVGSIVGSFFGPMGTAIGAVLGQVVGSLIKSGADEGLAQVRQVGDELQTRITKSEGGLGSQVKKIGDTIANVINSLESAIGGSITAASVGLKIRGEKIRVFAGSTTERFLAEFDNVADAVNFAVSHILSTAEFDSTISERFVTALQSGAAQSQEELINLIQVVHEIELAASNAGPIAEAFRVVAIDVKNVAQTASEAGLDAADAVLVQARKVRQIRDVITESIASAIGVSDVAGGIEDLVKSAEEFNAGLDAITASREAELEAAIAADAALTDMETALSSLPPGAVEIEVGLGVVKEGFKGFDRSLRGAAERSAAATINVDTFAAALEEMPKRINMKKIRDAAAVAAEGVGTTLIDMIESVRGKGKFEAQRMQLQEAAFKVQLAAQIVQMQLFANMTELFTENTRNMFQGLVDDGLSLLDDLNSGAASIGDQAVKAASGRGKARRAAEEAFNESAERVIAILAGATEADFAFADSVRAVRDQAKEAKKTLAETNQAITNLAKLEISEVAESWTAARQSIEQSNLGNAVTEIMGRAQESIDAINARASANQQAADQGLLQVSRGVQAEMHALGQETLLSLSGPITQLRASSKETIRDIRFMVRNVDDLGLTLDRVANKVREGIIPGLLAIGIQQAKRLGLDEEVARFEAMQAEIERKFTLVQLQVWRVMLESAGAMDEATSRLFDDITELVNLDVPPVEVPPIDVPTVDTSGIESGAAAVEETWTNTSEAVNESVEGMTATFTSLLVGLEEANRGLFAVGDTSVTLTAEMGGLASALFIVQKRTGKLIQKLADFPSDTSALSSVPGFAGGSNQFLDAGPESLVKIHGREEIVTESRADSIAGMVERAIQRGSSDGGSAFASAFLSRDDARTQREEKAAELMQELLRVLSAGDRQKPVSRQGVDRSM